MFHDLIPNKKGRTYCGPGALAILCNISYTDARAVIKDVSGKTRVTGVGPHHMRLAFDALGWKMSVDYHKSGDFPSFNTWMENRPHYYQNNVFLVAISKTKPHWILVHGDQMADNWTKTSVHYSKSPHLRKKVTGVYMLYDMQNNQKAHTLSRLGAKNLDHLQNLLTVHSLRKKALATIQSMGCTFDIERDIGRITINAPNGKVFYASGCASEYYTDDGKGTAWQEINDFFTNTQDIFVDDDDIG